MIPKNKPKPLIVPQIDVIITKKNNIDLTDLESNLIKFKQTMEKQERYILISEQPVKKELLQ